MLIWSKTVCQRSSPKETVMPRCPALPDGYLSGWVKQLFPIKISEAETVTFQGYKDLQKEVQRLKIKNKILKKATAIFAIEQ